MMKVLLEAPILTQSGYGEHSRHVFRSICEIENFDIYISPLNWGTTSWAGFLQKEEKEKIEQATQKFTSYIHECQSSQINPEFDLQIHVGIPNEFNKKAPRSICVTAGIETDRVSANWLVKTHQGIDKIITISEHSKSGFINTSYEAMNNETKQKTIIGCNCDVEVVPYPVKKLTPDPLKIELPTKFNFLSVALFGARKNIENSIRWFVEEFHDEDVGLVIKTGMSKGSNLDRQQTVQIVKNAIGNQRNRKCKVYLLHGTLSDAQIHSLYDREDIHCYMTATHAEGFGLPIFEAAYSGMPVVAPGWSGHLDFLSAPFKEGGKTKQKDLFAKVEVDIGPIPASAVWQDILVEGSQWSYPRERSFKNKLRKVYKNYGMYKKWAKALQAHVGITHEQSKISETMRKAILSVFPQQISEMEKIKKENNEVVVFD